MAHPHHEHKDHKVQRRRVGHLVKGYATGGHSEADEAEDRAIIRGMVKKTALRADGGAVKHRADRPRRASGGKVDHKEQKGHDDLKPFERAKGGRAKHKGHTTVNVMIAAPHGGLGGAPPLPPPGALPPMRPPMAAPVPPPAPAGVMTRPPMGPPGSPPPGMPARRTGGRVNRASGGKVTDGPAYMEGKNARPVDHAPGKMDGPDMGRGKVVTYKNGGSVGRRLVQFWVGGAVERKRGGRIKDGLGVHHTVHGKSARASGGLEHSGGPHHGGGSEAPHHPRKGLGPIDHPLKGGMSPDFKAGAGGGEARQKKIKRVEGFINRVP